MTETKVRMRLRQYRTIQPGDIIEHHSDLKVVTAAKQHNGYSHIKEHTGEV